MVGSGIAGGPAAPKTAGFFKEPSADHADTSQRDGGLDATSEIRYHPAFTIMDLKITPSRDLAGRIAIPPNKSHSFRALIMASLADGVSCIRQPAESNDWHLGVAAMRRFGATIETDGEGTWTITGVGGRPALPDDIIDCGNSGILLRFLAALAGCCDGHTVLTGDHSLRHIRLCQPMLDAINALGGKAVSTKSDGHAPIVISGPMDGGGVTIDGLDSQPISAMLIAASLLDQPTVIGVPNPGERPWIEMTFHWLNQCGVTIEHDDYSQYRIAGRARLTPFDVTIPLDWSAALYPIVAGVLTPGADVFVPGMNFDDCQGDKGVVTVLQQMGADITVSSEGVRARHSRLRGMEIDCNDFIDQFMLLAVVGACAEGATTLTNAEACRHKECDRITAMDEALTAMGVRVENRPDGLLVHQSDLMGTTRSSLHDHRMVMSLSVAALVATGETTITDIECVEKTFPDFVEQMTLLGADLSAG
jgi:3-phosphoshikimate 1-carboxyvinyltransferase